MEWSDIEGDRLSNLINGRSLNKQFNITDNFDCFPSFFVSIDAKILFNDDANKYVVEELNDIQNIIIKLDSLLLENVKSLNYYVVNKLQNTNTINE